MIAGITEGRFWSEGKFVCSPFRRDMKVLIYSSADKDYAELCVRDFNNISGELLGRLCRAAVLYCFASLNSWAEIDKRDEIEAKLSVPLTPDMPPEKILNCLRPVILSVRESQDGQIGYSVEFDCDFEPEHGMEAVFLGGELIYAGPFADYSAWDDFPPDDPMNYAARIG